MLEHLRHRWPLALRAVALLAFALCLAAKPVLADWGEMHELVAHAGSALSHSGHDHAHAPASDGGDAGDPAHLLLHYAHCCGQSAGLVDLAGPPRAASFAPARPPLSAVPAPRTPRLAAPFRPPIS